MKKILIFLGLACISSFFFACHDDSGSNSPKASDTLSLYYSYDTLANKLSQNDTLFVPLGKTFSVNVKSNLSYYKFCSVDDKISVKENGSNQFTCTPIETGVTLVDAFGSTSSEDGISSIVTKLYVKVLPVSRTFFVNDDAPTSNIDVSSDSLKSIIQSELVYYTQYYVEYKFTYDTEFTGDLSVTTSNASVTGRFFSNLSDMSNITMNYNDSTFYFTLKRRDGYSGYYWLTRNLTSIFQKKYPKETINSVTMTAAAFSTSLDLVP